MTSRAVARRYARALFDVSLKEADLDRVERELASFADLVERHADLARALHNPAVPTPRKRAAVEALMALAGPFSPVVAKLLPLLAERDRLMLLPDLLEAYRDRLLDHRRVVRAEVTTAVALPGDRTAALQAGLAKVTGRDVQLQVRVDPAILGGVVARVGSLVFDGSVVRQLERMKARLAEGGEPGAR